MGEDRALECIVPPRHPFVGDMRAELFIARSYEEWEYEGGYVISELALSAFEEDVHAVLEDAVARGTTNPYLVYFLVAYKTHGDGSVSVRHRRYRKADRRSSRDRAYGRAVIIHDWTPGYPDY